MSLAARHDTRTPAAGRARPKIFGADAAATPRTALGLLSGNAPKQQLQQQQQQQQQQLTSESAPAPGVKVAPSEPPESAPPLDYDSPYEWEFLPDHSDWMSLLQRVAALPAAGKENVPPPDCFLGDESPRRRDYDCLELDFDLDRIL